MDHDYGVHGFNDLQEFQDISESHRVADLKAQRTPRSRHDEPSLRSGGY